MPRRFLLPLPLLLATTLLGAASTQEPTPVKLLDEFVTGGFLGPPEGFQTPERFAEVADANIKLIVIASGDHKLALDLAQEGGVLVVPWDVRIAPLVFQPDVPVDPAIINALVADYADHPAMGAYVVRDTNAFALEVGGLLAGWDNRAVLRKTCNVVFGEDTPRATVEAPGAQLLMGTFEKDVAARLFVANDSPHAPTRAKLGPGPFKAPAARGGWLEGTEVLLAPGGALLLEVGVTPPEG